MPLAATRKPHVHAMWRETAGIDLVERVRAPFSVFAASWPLGLGGLYKLSRVQR